MILFLPDSSYHFLPLQHKYQTMLQVSACLSFQKMPVHKKEYGIACEKYLSTE